MPKVKVNLLSPEDQKEIQISQAERLIAREYPRRFKRKYNFKKLIASVVIIIVITLAVFSSSIVFSDENLIKNLAKLNLLEQVGRLIGAGNKDLIGENDDRINILLIGMGGKNHEGGTLADTIILGSFKPSTNQLAMLSIPRDLSVKTADYNWIKINTLNAYAEKKQAGSGGKEMARALSELLDTEITYYITIDFSGFERLIDEFGGVAVEVERNLIDKEYPIRGQEDVFPITNRYETLDIKKGWQQMNGELALKYARSRHALGVEGSDFARSRRQQKILAALKEKIFDLETFLNPKKINSLLTAYNEHIYTNLEIWQLLRLAQIGKNADVSKIISHTLADGPSGLVYPQIINDAYVLLLKDSSYKNIRMLWKNIFYAPSSEFLTTANKSSLPSMAATTNATTTELKSPPISPGPATTTLPTSLINDYKKEGATIDIRNGTWTTGLAAKEQVKLEKIGLEVIAAANANHHDYAKTLIYDFSKGANPGTALELTKIYGLKPTTTWPISLNSSADFLIILGRN